jgi:hypothetical protein
VTIVVGCVYRTKSSFQGSLRHRHGLAKSLLQRLVIITIADDYPWQAITAVNASGASVAERTMTIINIGSSRNRVGEVRV